MSKTSEKSLSPTLKKCRRNRSDTKQHCIDNKSAWEQRQPASMSTGRSRSGLSKSEGRIRSGLSKSEGRIKSGLSKSMGRSRSGLSLGRSRGSGISLGRSMGSGLSITVEEPHFTTETRDAYYTGMADIIETPSSSESLSLPVEVSPAYKFVPIGYEEDADYYKSFDSQDYDICKEFNDDEIDQEAKAPSVKIVVGSSSAKNVVPPSPGSDASTDDKYAPSSSSGHKQAAASCTSSYKQHGVGYINRQQDLPPSPVPTDDISEESNDFVHTSQASKKQQFEDRYNIDRYQCALSEHIEDQDWFLDVKQEIMKMSSFFMSSCGAKTGDTL